MEILSDRLANIAWQRHRLVTTGLAVHGEFARSPVKVVEHHRHDLASAQPEAGKKEQDRVVSPPPRVSSVTALE